MKQEINIITPCSRPENLRLIRQSINIPCNWIIVYDSETTQNNFGEHWINELNIRGGIAGKQQINLALETLEPDAWFYVLDDDNLLHPDFKYLVEQLALMNYIKGFIFGQELDNHNFRIPDKNNIKVCHVDQAQYLLNMQIIGKKRFIQKYEADGHFIEEIYNKHFDEILIVEKVMSYYNKLKWK